MVEKIQLLTEPLTRTGFIILGTIGGTIYLAMTILYHRLIQNMKKDKETAITKFFLKKDTVKAFKTMAISGFILVTLLAAELTGIILQNIYITTTARTLLPIPMTGLAYFAYTVQKNTDTN